LQAHRFLLASRLSEGASRAQDTCGVSSLRSDLAWEGFSRAHPEAAHMTCWTIAVKAADGNTVGLLLVLCPETRRPDQAELQTLSMASNLATICIEHHQMTCQLSHLVRHDRLTGLPNRLMLEDRMHQALALARRSGNKVSVMVLDIDKFKSINDTMGHQAGDHLLQQFAQRLSGVLRETDTMARIGGDEFVIVLPELTAKEAAAVVARKLIDSLAQPFAYGDRCIRATTSIGIALFPNDGDDAVTIQKRADEALYRVKEQGRNGFSF
jgi:diguanylate cyclase (GGDEF)-like protein